MPTYTYVCKSCDSVRDVFHSMTRNPRVKCPSCGHTRMARMMGRGAGLIFKGSGFYETDYKRNGGKSEVKPESASGSKAESKSEATSEAKTETKADTKPAKSEGKSKRSTSDS